MPPNRPVRYSHPNFFSQQTSSANSNTNAWSRQSSATSTAPQLLPSPDTPNYNYGIQHPRTNTSNYSPNGMTFVDFKYQTPPFSASGNHNAPEISMDAFESFHFPLMSQYATSPILPTPSTISSRRHNQAHSRMPTTVSPRAQMLTAAHANAFNFNESYASNLSQGQIQGQQTGAYYPQYLESQPYSSAQYNTSSGVPLSSSIPSGTPNNQGRGAYQNGPSRSPRTPNHYAPPVAQRPALSAHRQAMSHNSTRYGPRSSIPYQRTFQATRNEHTPAISRTQTSQHNQHAPRATHQRRQVNNSRTILPLAPSNASLTSPIGHSNAIYPQAVPAQGPRPRGSNTLLPPATIATRRNHAPTRTAPLAQGVPSERLNTHTQQSPALATPRRSIAAEVRSSDKRGYLGHPMRIDDSEPPKSEEPVLPIKEPLAQAAATNTLSKSPHILNLASQKLQACKAGEFTTATILGRRSRDASEEDENGNYLDDPTPRKRFVRLSTEDYYDQIVNVLTGEIYLRLKRWEKDLWLSIPAVISTILDEEIGVRVPDNVQKRSVQEEKELENYLAGRIAIVEKALLCK